ncbi:tetratricopeptide repeat protein [Actinomadura luteofluorescens]|uniref:tetratricopeptide repeat protein n=1 Tax=Actinomadura luteofluorescens TaxID=46163 RepID=UPI0030CB2BAB
MSQDARVKDGGEVTQIAGDQIITHHHHYYPLGGAAPATVDRVRVGVVPRLADCFQERAGAEPVRAAADDGSTVVLPQASTQVATRVLAGMGGVGKTQLAAAYARHAWEQGIEVLVWVEAASRDMVISAYADAALRLGLPSADREDPERSAREFLIWAETTTRRWLVVLDDVCSPGDMRGLWPMAVSTTGTAEASGGCPGESLDGSSCGEVMVTTRLRNAALAATSRCVIEVAIFTEEEARCYLSARLADRAADPVQVDALARDLGYLPLALAQAAAYMLNTDLDCAAYRRLLDTRLLHRVLPNQQDLPDDHERIVAATWELSIGQADRAHPAGLARSVLSLISFMDPAGIPQAVLTSPPVLEYLVGHLPEISHGWEVDAEAVDEVLRVLHRHSLIDHKRTALYLEIRVHQLVQRATRESFIAQPELGSTLFAELVHVAAEALLSVWPGNHQDFSSQQFSTTLRANTAALHSSSGAILWERNNQGHPVLFHAANSLGHAGRVAAAHTANAELRATAQRIFGPDHPDVLTARYNCATWQGGLGDMAGAAGELQQLLTDRQRILGPDHPDTLNTKGNLAYCRGKAGDAAGAASLFEEMLTYFIRRHGPDHPSTQNARHNLAHWRGEAGDASGAATALEQLLADRLRILGPDDPSTLNTRHYLARWRGEAGDASGAATALEQLLADQLRILGPDDPSTLNTRHYLARWRGEAGDASGAATALEQLLADQLRILDPGHLHTSNTRRSLAYWRGQASRE